MTLENINSDIMHKAIPSLAMAFSLSKNRWEILESNNVTSFSEEINFADALNQQKASEKYLFIYDKSIENWRPITKP